MRYNIMRLIRDFFRRLNAWFDDLDPIDQSLTFFGGVGIIACTMWFPATTVVGYGLFLFACAWGLSRL